MKLSNTIALLTVALITLSSTASQAANLVKAEQVKPEHALTLAKLDITMSLNDLIVDTKSVKETAKNLLIEKSTPTIKGNKTSLVSLIAE